MCTSGAINIVFVSDVIKHFKNISVGCPVGEYYDVVFGSCHECTLNTYQDEVGKSECKSCPQNTQTAKPGATNVTQCIAT